MAQVKHGNGNGPGAEQPSGYWIRLNDYADTAAAKELSYSDISFPVEGDAQKLCDLINKQAEKIRRENKPPTPAFRMRRKPSS